MKKTLYMTVPMIKKSIRSNISVTSLRYHNRDVHLGESGHIIHPLNTDDIIVNIRNIKLNFDISSNDISRSQVVSKVQN